MHKKILIIVAVIAVLLLSGCVSEQPAAKTWNESKISPNTTVRPLPGKNLFGPADSFKISLKQYASQVDALAKENFADACLILVTSEYPNNKDVGKASLWHYKYYSKAQDRALVVDVDVRETAGKLYAYGGVKFVNVLRGEPYKPCITLLSDTTQIGAAT